MTRQVWPIVTWAVLFVLHWIFLFQLAELRVFGTPLTLITLPALFLLGAVTVWPAVRALSASREREPPDL